MKRSLLCAADRKLFAYRGEVDLEGFRQPYGCCPTGVAIDNNPQKQTSDEIEHTWQERMERLRAL